MKFFLDRHKTLLPRVDIVYSLSRVLVLASLLWYTFVIDSAELDHTLFLGVDITYTLHLTVFILAIRGSFDIKLAYLSAIVYDLLLIPLLIFNTGGIDSSFYPLIYIVVSVAAYVLTFWFSVAATLLATLGYLVAIVPSASVESLFDTSMRVGFIWIYYFAILYASDYMRKSEKRLLKLFNTLNKRTSELEKSQAHLEMIYENTRILASILDTDGVVKEVMRLMGSLLQYRSYGVIFRDVQDNLFFRARFEKDHANYHLKAIDPAKVGLLKKVTSVGESIIIKDMSGRTDYVPLNEDTRSVMIVPMVSHGHINGILVAESNTADYFTERDIQILSMVARSAALALENAQLHKRTEELTIIDELTGAYNYRYFVQKLQEEKRRAARYSLPLSLIMVDIDWFKKLNDTYGHESGNLVLKKLSGIIKRCTRDVDLFARYGGEEFAIVLPQTSGREALIIGERIREQVEAETFQTVKGESLHVTVSVGISSFPENGKPQEELVSVADQALYRAKGEGRNLVRVI